MDPGGSSFPLAEIAFTVCLQLFNVNVWRNENCDAASLNTGPFHRMTKTRTWQAKRSVVCSAS